MLQGEFGRKIIQPKIGSEPNKDGREILTILPRGLKYVGGDDAKDNDNAYDNVDII